MNGTLMARKKMIDTDVFLWKTCALPACVIDSNGSHKINIQVNRIGKIFRYSCVASLMSFLLFAGCEPQFDEVEVTSGTADFTSYVAIGSSYTSGFADGALSKFGQKASFPYLLSQRMEKAGGGEFNIPFLKGDKGTFPDYNVTQPERYKLTLPRLGLVNEPDCKGEIGLKPERIAAIGDNEIDLDDESQRIASPGKNFHLLGIPAMKAVQMIFPGYADVASYTANLPFSPYYWRFATDLRTSTLIEETKAANPTFFTMEIGMGDVSNYATDGGVGNINGQNDEDIPSENTFRASVEYVLDSLIAWGANGVVANIPDITQFPFFTRIEYDLLELDNAEAQQLNTQWAAEGLTFQAGAHNSFVIRENGQVRKIKSTELIMLNIPVDSLKCYGWGDSIPIPDKYVLSEEEIGNIRTFTDLFNSIIAEETTERGIALVDLRRLLSNIHDETTISGINLSAEFVSGGFFSLDGLHPTPRGHAIIANAFIETINEQFGATLPRYQVADFEGVVFP